jgi:hypothetical protein
LRIQDVELILAITFGKDQGLARRKREKERVTPEFGERKEEKILPPNSGRYRSAGGQTAPVVGAEVAAGEVLVAGGITATIRAPGLRLFVLVLAPRA